MTYYFTFLLWRQILRIGRKFLRSIIACWTGLISGFLSLFYFSRTFGLQLSIQVFYSCFFWICFSVLDSLIHKLGTMKEVGCL